MNVRVKGERVRFMRELLNKKLLELRFYKLALDIFELAWDDCDVLQKDRKAWPMADQLIRSSGSISANIEEGYGRESTKEYMRFLKIARGSAIETQGWYYKSNKILSENTIKERMIILNEIIGKLSGTINTLKSRV